MLNKSLFSSDTVYWETPQWLFDELNQEFNFKVDVCATPENTKCNTFFSEQENGLNKDWYLYKSCWMNPPYGTAIHKWIKKAYEQSLYGATVVCLLPARIDTNWFHNYCLQSDEIRLIRGRLKFSNSKNSAPFPSCIVVFKSFFEKKLNCPLFKSVNNKPQLIYKEQ